MIVGSLSKWGCVYDRKWRYSFQWPQDLNCPEVLTKLVNVVWRAIVSFGEEDWKWVEVKL